MDRFADVFSIQSEDTDALQMSAQCLFQLGLHTQAMKMVERAIGTTPSFGPAHATRGELLLKQGNATKAIHDLQLAADLLPNDAVLLARLAIACAKTQDFDCASRFFGYAIHQNPHIGETHFGLAMIQLRNGDKRTAHKSFAHAIELNPTNPTYYEGAANLARLEGSKEKARSLLGEARRARSFERSLQKLTSLVDTTQMMVALQTCDCNQQTGCKNLDPACFKAVHDLPQVPQDFFRASLAIRENDIS
ncbi:MAG: tetratricopeptide repeat protein [Pseudomonadota bacterium]